LNLKRREFIKASTISGLAVSIGANIVGCESSDDGIPFKGKRLILIKLDGGNDGLHSFFPKNDDFIASLRPGLSKYVNKNGISLSKNWLLNKDLKDLMPVIESNEMAVLPYVGYPEPNTSHFKSSEIWDSASLPGEKNFNTGWIGRLLDKGILSLPNNETPVISLSDFEPLLIKGVNKNGFSWQNNETFHWYASDIQHWLSHFQGSPIRQELLKTYQMHQDLAEVSSLPGFPDSNLGNQLAKISTIIKMDKPYKVFYASQQGYDTHVYAKERLGILYNDLASSLRALVQSLKVRHQWKDTMVLIYSEFGRTIRENTNGGTDHGAAGLCLILGDNHFIDKYNQMDFLPQFTEMAGDYYLAHQLDFRDLYADIQKAWLV
jgi:uncharacterized protein (DUF1501 family)